MKRCIRSAVVLVGVVFGALLGGLPAAGSVLPALTGSGFIVTDPANHQVFVSGRPSVVTGWSAPLYVMKDDGSLKTTLGVSGAAGMVRDGGTLYVLRCESDQIAVVDTATLTITEQISLSETSSYPCDLALAGGRLWFPAATVGHDTHLASVTVASPHVVHDTTMETNDGLIAGPPGGSTLIVFDTGSVMALDASTDTPTLISNRNLGTNFYQPVISPDGSLVTGSFDVPVMAVPSLTDATGYPATGDATAFSSTGSWIATSRLHTIAVTAKGASAPVNTYPLGTSQAVTLAFSPDLTHLYAIVQPSTGAASLVTLSAPTLPRPALTLTASAKTITFGQRAGVTATLAASDPTGVIQLLRKAPTGSFIPVAQGTIGSDRRVSFSVKPNATSTYIARLMPDSHFGPSESRQVSVGVHARVTMRALGYYGTSGGYDHYHYLVSCPQHHQNCPGFTATVLPNHAGKPVTFSLQTYSGGSWHRVLTARLKLGTKSRATIRLVYGSRAIIGVRNRIRAEFPPDADHRAGVSPWSSFVVTQ